MGARPPVTAESTVPAVASTIEILVNGRAGVSIAIHDRGLQFGDGLFETLAIVDGWPCLLEAHLARLQAGCSRLGLPAPPLALLRDEIAVLSAGQARAVLKLIYTAGVGERGYARPAEPQPTRILIRSPATRHPAAHWRLGVPLRFCRTRLGAQPQLAGIKHLNRLEQVLARRELEADGAAEGLMLGHDGAVIEAVSSNLFVLREGRLLTPCLRQAGVAGIMRGRIMELANTLGWPVEETRLEADVVRGADELFVSNSLIGLWPVSSIEARPLPRHEVAHALLRALVEARLFLLPDEVSFDS